MAAQVFPFGVNAGSTAKLDASTSYSVKTNPTYGLQVSMDSAQSRVIQTDETARMRNFTVQYSMENAGTASQRISVDVLQKSGGTYTAVTAPWTVNGNATLSPGSGTQSITVTVPEELNPGTYRLLFRLGDQEVPYNLIVQGR